ncbi:hypothetical protein K503DRAFT_864601 [Rhizopogon vinicolor AM-OR11-026]|uniref:Uncharacterized protein n=1 Tax=Rhizopogon vinicolor AM-OR11-026 TaxID=1314800 RepID=A0A1B7N6K3_9AGAM|nr:hypothetical protein K503DRAFT_864601 [Rhizopogon vinicolor AM-OR11-026]
MPRDQLQAPGLSNIISFYVILLCVSQVHASCQLSFDNNCPPSLPPQAFIGIIVVGCAIALAIIIGIITRIIRRRRFHQRNVLPDYRANTGRGVPNNSYGSRQPSRPIPTQMNSWSQHTPPPPSPKPLHSPSITSSPTRCPHPNQTHFSSPPRQPGGPSPPPHALSLPHSPHSSPLEPVRVSEDPPWAETLSAAVTPVTSSPSHSHVATSVVRQSPPENMEMHPLRVNTEAVNDEPPPAYTVYTPT